MKLGITDYICECVREGRDRTQSACDLMELKANEIEENMENSHNNLKDTRCNRCRKKDERMKNNHKVPSDLFYKT